MNKIAILSHVLPPSPSGQAVMLYRILSGIDPQAFYLVNTHAASLQVEPAPERPWELSAQQYSLPPEPANSAARVWGIGRIVRLVSIFTGIYARVCSILNILRQEPETRAIIACTGDQADIPAGFLASKMTHLPFYAYIFDDYVFQWTGLHRLMASWMASIIFKHTAGVIGPNEYICEEYKRRFGVHTILVRNPCDKDELDKEPYPQWPGESGKIKIIYTGAIYHANFDCFLNLIKAMDSLIEYKPELHIFTAQTQGELENKGIKSDKIFVHSHIPYDEILEQQRKADILFLPLAFESPIPEVIRTSAPGKMGEYLASGRPVLAHVPANSFVAYYFKKNQCGWIADQNNPDLLALAIANIILDPESRVTITYKALQQAKIDFSPDNARDQLLRLMRSQ
jgi:glycosyltransferase involved in cell wall biosynthesis